MARSLGILFAHARSTAEGPRSGALCLGGQTWPVEASIDVFGAAWRAASQA